MARIKIDLPDHFSFHTTIPIRITDVNYGGHVGNNVILSLLHECRMQMLAQHGYTELNLAGIGIIMSDVAIEFKNELFYGETVHAAITASNFSRVSFDLYYKLEKSGDGNKVPVAFAKTGMVCYDYSKKKVTALPEGVALQLAAST